MNREIFHNSNFENQIRENGYLIIPLLNDEEVSQLLEKYNHKRPDIKSGFHSTSTNNNIEYRKEVDAFIKSIFEPKTKELLINYTPVYASFVVKEPGREGNFPLHMDWSMVDERNFISLAFWTPLIVVNKENGPLQVLEKSHKLGLSYRGGPHLFQLVEKKNDIKNKKFKLKTLEVKPGEVVIYDHRLFHGSSINYTSATRPALNFTVIPNEAQLIHYQFYNNKLFQFNIDKKFFLEYIMGTQPSQYLCTLLSCKEGLLLDDKIISNFVL